MAKKTLFRLLWGHDFEKGTLCAPVVPLGFIGENEITPRICVADTISGCLTSIGAAYVGELGITKAIKSFRAVNPNAPLDMEKIWRSSVYPFTILEFTVDTDDPMILTPAQIVNDVNDALTTGEHWILNERKPDRIRKVWLYSARIQDVTIHLTDGRKALCAVFSNDQWAAKKTRPTISFITALNSVFVKAMKQYREHGHNLPY